MKGSLSYEPNVNLYSNSAIVIVPLYKNIMFLILAAVCLMGFTINPIALLMGFLLTLFLGRTFENYALKEIPYFPKILIMGSGFGMLITRTFKTG